MKMKMKIKNILQALALGVIFTGCNDFLDAMPDSRIEVDTPKEIKALLNSAYPQASYVRITELASDNADDLNGPENGYYDRFSEQCFKWEAVSESDNESPAMVWQDYYKAIASANHALAAIEKIGGASTDEIKALKGEALLCRAFSHFMLTNLFCLNYSQTHSATDLGIPYITEPETTLNPSYNRGTVAEDYAKIEKDLLEGLSLMSDAIYTVPRYHFNTRAAYTFASRFYLFYQKPEEVIKYSTLALGDNPRALMRDYDLYAGMPTDDMQPRSQQYTSSSEMANLLLLPVYSTDQYYYSGASTGARFNNNSYIAQAEQLFITPWMPSDQRIQQSQALYKMYWFYNPTYNKILFPKQPAYFEEVNSGNHTGYYRTLVVALKIEEALLNRAEAYTILGQFDKALADINIWTNNFIVDKVVYKNFDGYDEFWQPVYSDLELPVPNTLTMGMIRKWARSYPYYQPQAPTPFKHINPEWIDVHEGTDLEAMLQCLLLIRRLEFIHEGMRWFDIKRYGIKIYRRMIIAAINTMEITDEMDYRDPRQAIQLPLEVRGAGLQGNPRPQPDAAEYQLWTQNNAGMSLTFNN